MASNNAPGDEEPLTPKAVFRFWVPSTLVGAPPPKCIEHLLQKRSLAEKLPEGGLLRYCYGNDALYLLAGVADSAARMEVSAECCAREGA